MNPSFPFLKWSASALSVVAILAATLWPGSPGASPSAGWCILCGERGVADGILNVLLFLPLGVALRSHGARLQPILIAAALLSGAIEIAQVFIPGRDPSMRDILVNVTGAGTGALIAGRAIPFATSRFSLGPVAGVLALLVMLATGVLLRPSYSRDDYYAQWTQIRFNRENYRGRVLDASIGGLSLPPGRLRASDSVRTLLNQGTEVRFAVAAGPPVSAYAPIFGIVDAHTRELLVVAATTDDLVLRVRTASAAARLDQPDLRARGAMRNVAAGDTLGVVVWREGGTWCMAVNETRYCDEFRLASGWRILFAWDGLSRWGNTLISLLWIGGLCFPAGFVGGRSWTVVAGIGLVTLGLAVVPAITGLGATSPAEWLAAASGVVVGVIAGTLVRAAGYLRPPRVI